MWLKIVFDKRAMVGLILNPDKCDFFKPEVRYLGFSVNHESLKINAAKVAPINDYSAPELAVKSVAGWAWPTGIEDLY